MIRRAFFSLLTYALFTPKFIPPMATARAQRTVSPSPEDHLQPRHSLGPEFQSARFPEEFLHAVTRGTEILSRAAEERQSPPLPTAISPLDQSLTGGLPRGCLFEVTGRNTSGRFSLVLSTLAATTIAGDVAALIDLGDSLDPGNASELGVDLDRLLWLRPKHLKPALIATEIALQTGFPLVILDLGQPPVPGGRGPASAWLRLTRAAATSQSVVCVSSPYRVSGPAAATVFETERAESSWLGGNRAPCLLEAIRFHWRLLKTRHNSHNQRVSFALSSPETLLGSTANIEFLTTAPCADRKKTVETSSTATEQRKVLEASL